MATQPVNYQVRAVSRALKILTAFTSERHTLTLKELSEELSLNKSTLIRILSCLESEGFIEKADSEGFRLGIKAFEVGSAYYMSHLPVAQVARAYMTELVSTWQLSANLAVLDRDEIVYVDIVEPQLPLRVRFSIGSRAEVHCTALGKVLVSELPWSAVERILTVKGMKRYTPNTIVTPDAFKKCLEKVRAQGYALDHEEVLVGVRCIAAPVRGRSSEIIGALSLSGPLSVFTDEIVEPVAESLMEAASAMSDSLTRAFYA